MNIAEKIIRAKADYDAVYEAGKKANHGDGAGYDAGYEAGQKAKLSELWEYIQNKGKRDNYSYYFSYWSSDDFYPKYDFVLANNALDGQNANIGMFRNFNKNGDANFDLVARLEECGVTLDTSKCKNLMYFFYAAKTRRARVDISNAANCYMAFYASPAEVIELVASSVTRFHANTFGFCADLKELYINKDKNREPSIYSNFDVHWSEGLIKASLVNIIKNLRVSAGEPLTVTLPKEAVNREFQIDIDDPSTYPEGSEWYELRNSRSKWNFNFI